jgi:hypothetical protein
MTREICTGLPTMSTAISDAVASSVSARCRASSATEVLPRCSSHPAISDSIQASLREPRISWRREKHRWTIRRVDSRAMPFPLHDG